MILRIKRREKSIEELKDIWRHNGAYFGYPKCCIEAFCTTHERGEDIGDRVIESYGFIPCIEHYNQIRAGAITIEELVNTSARMHFEPYPLDGY